MQREKSELVSLHRSERERTREGQEKRRQDETRVRSERLNKGVRGLIDWVSGKTKSTKNRNELEARQCMLRDRKQRDDLVKAQMSDRQALQKRFDTIRKKQIQDRKLLARDVSKFLRDTERRSQTDANRPRERARNHKRDHGPKFEL